MQAVEDQQQQHLDDDAKVKLRDKRNAAMREPSKRHSWSPRTTISSSASVGTVTAQVVVVDPAADKTIVKRDEGSEDADDIMKRREMPKFTAKSSVLARVLVDSQKAASRTVIEGVVGQVQYQPAAVQLPEAPPHKRGFVCEVQPLIDDSKEALVLDEGEEELSDAGTYTLDGDNYTEEQKEMMDIDNLRKERQLLNKWEDLMAAQRQEEEREQQEEDELAMTFLKCKRTPLQRPTSFEPSLEVS